MFIKIAGRNVIPLDMVIVDRDSGELKSSGFYGS